MSRSILLKVTREAYAHLAGNMTWNITCRIVGLKTELQNIIQSKNDMNDVSNG